jgi:hypothetical protein
MTGFVKTSIALTAALSAALVVSGCNKPKEKTPAAAGAPATTATQAPMPPLPAWASGFVGKPLQVSFQGPPATCIGNADMVLKRFGGDAPGVQIIGWAWDPKTKAEIGRILLVDSGGDVQGAGESGMPRPDVNTARPSITSKNTGWAANTHLMTGPVDAYGVVDDGKAVCLLSRLAY